MSTDEHNRFLVYPLYKLYYIDDVDGFSFDEEEVRRIKELYSGRELEGIIAACRWALEKPDMDLTGLLPNLPHSNEKIHRYLEKVLKALKG